MLALLVVASLLQAQTMTFDQADRLLKAGSYNDAIDAFEEYLDSNEEDANAYFKIGVASLQIEKYKKAIISFSQAIIFGKNSVAVYNNRAYAYALNNQYFEAITDYDSVIAKKPSSEAYIERGKMKVRTGDERGAIGDYDLAAELDPKNAIVFEERAVLKSMLKMHDEALKDYKKAVDIEPSETLFFKIAQMESSFGRDEIAIYYFDKAIKLNGDNVYYYDERANAKMALGLYKDAIEDLNTAEKLDPDDVNHFMERGLAYHNIEQYDKALKDFNQAIRLTPHDSKLYLYRAASHFGMNDNKSVLTDLRKVIELDPSNIDAYLFKGDAYTNLLDYPKAIEYYSKYIELEPNNYAVYRKRGDAKYSNRDYEAAIEDYNQVLNMNKNIALVYNNRGVSYFNLNRLDEACADLNTAKEKGFSQGYQLLKRNCKNLD